jgi:hypothetical protein
VCSIVRLFEYAPLVLVRKREHVLWANLMSFNLAGDALFTRLRQCGVSTNYQVFRASSIWWTIVQIELPDSLIPFGDLVSIAR